MSRTKKLTILEQRLCDIYFIMKKPNQGKAYELAGYKSRGRTAEVEASKTLRKPKCKEYLAKLAEKATTKTVKTAEDVIAELENLGFSNMGDFVTFNSRSGIVVFDSEKLSRDQLAAVQEVSQVSYDYYDKKGRRKTRKHFKFRLQDKKGPLEILARKFNLLKEKTEVVHSGKIEIVHFSKPTKKPK